MEPYRINLDVYNGPLDLLLYLIRRDEVDVYDIPIAHVTEQYCHYVDLMKQLDPNLAGEFLVMAASLVEIKSRMLLPSAPPAEDGQPDDLGDPRADLVRQLLEYKAFKDAALQLREAGQDQAMRHARRPVRPDFEEGELDLENVQVWHLLEAFNQIMTSVGQRVDVHEVIYDDTPVALHAEDILDRLRRDGSLTFREVFAGREDRSEMIGLFLAMLELIRQRKIAIEQETAFGEIYIFLKGESDSTEDTRSEDAMIAANPNEPLKPQRPDTPDLQSERGLIVAAGAALDQEIEPVQSINRLAAEQRMPEAAGTYQPVAQDDDKNDEDWEPDEEDEFDEDIDADEFDDEDLDDEDVEEKDDEDL